MYPGGFDARTADIEAGAGRTAEALVDDVRMSAARLELAFARLSDDAWAGEGLTVLGPASIEDLPFRRWREVEVHHADLGLGYSPADWPADYVRSELRVLTMLWDSRVAGTAEEGFTTPAGAALPPGLESVSAAHAATA